MWKLSKWEKAVLLDEIINLLRDSWHSGLPLVCFLPLPRQQSSPYRAGRVLRLACNILLKSLYGLVLAALGCWEDSSSWTMLSPVYVCLISWKLTELVNNLSILFLLSPSTAVCGSKRLSRAQWSCRPSVFGDEFYRLVQQLAIWLRVTVWGCMVRCFCFFRLNKEQHKLVLCCWFLFSISGDCLLFKWNTSDQ